MFDRQRRGAKAEVSGRMAEDQAARHYEVAGCDILARRWRGSRGEIDMIVREGETIVFVEVKSSSTHLRAGESLSRRQMDRICESALEYCGRLDADMRFDAVLVDRIGRLEVVQNAFWAN